MNSQTCSKASPPCNKAGAKLRAGFTEVPVIPIPNKCTRVSVKPITIPATALFSFLAVVNSTTDTKINVRIISVLLDIWMSVFASLLVC